jgi:hypothetical protein
MGYFYIDETVVGLQPGPANLFNCGNMGFFRATGPPTCTGAGPSGNPNISTSLTTYNVYATEVQNAFAVKFYVSTGLGNINEPYLSPLEPTGTVTDSIDLVTSNNNYIGRYFVDVYLVDHNYNDLVYCGSAPFTRGTYTPPPPTCLNPSISTPPLKFWAWNILKFTATVYLSGGGYGTQSLSATCGTLNSPTSVQVGPGNDRHTPITRNQYDYWLTPWLTPGNSQTCTITGTITNDQGVSATCSQDILTVAPTPSPAPSPTPTPTPAIVKPWWQVKDGDVTTNGDLNSVVPATSPVPYFDIKGSGGYPGIPAYNGSTDLNLTSPLNVSETSWLVKSNYASTKTYKTAYFLNAIPSDISTTATPATLKELGPVISQSDFDVPNLPTPDSAGYYWYEYDPSANGNGGAIPEIGTLSLGTKKVIVIVKGSNVTLKGNITLTKGQGFFMLASGANPDGTKGDITVDPGVGGAPPQAGPNLEGIYVADGKFLTGIAATQLLVRGTVVAYGGLTLQRDLGTTNATTPAELFEFAPDLELLYPQTLAVHNMTWREVAP